VVQHLAHQMRFALSDCAASIYGSAAGSGTDEAVRISKLLSESGHHLWRPSLFQVDHLVEHLVEHLTDSPTDVIPQKRAQRFGGTLRNPDIGLYRREERPHCMKRGHSTAAAQGNGFMKLEGSAPKETPPFGWFFWVL